MKKSAKILSGVCAMALAACLGTTAFAAEVTGSGSITEDNTASANVIVSVTPYTEATKEYYVAIDLTDLTYTYNQGSEGSWNTTDMKYENATTAGWQDGDATNAPAKTFKVSNQSNASVWVTAAWTPTGNSADGLTVDITVDSADAATEKELTEATPGTDSNGTPTEATYNVALTGTPTDASILASGGQIGTITVTVASSASEAA